MIPIEHIHPMLVHFPIVFFLMLAVLDMAAAARGHDVTGRTAAGNLSTALAVLAALSAVAAFAFGDAALEIAEAAGFSNELAEIHEGLGTATAAIFVIWALVRVYLWMKGRNLRGGSKWLIGAMETAGAVLVLTTAYYGGMLVYDLGVNVAHAAQ